MALTADVWTDRHMHAFLGVTVHTFLDGMLESHLLVFKALSGSHTGQKIADEMDAKVRDFGVKDKVVIVVTDNASNMLKAMCLFFPLPDDSRQNDAAHVDDTELWKDLPDEEAEVAISDMGSRIACFCHSIQLVVRGGLEKTAAVVRPAIAKVSKLTSVIHQSQLFRNTYEEKFGVGRSCQLHTTLAGTARICSFMQLLIMINQSSSSCSKRALTKIWSLRQRN